MPAKPQPLNARTLKYWSDHVAVPTYDRSLVTPGVVHVGVGGFHRAHQAMYLDDLAQRGITLDWGERGVGLLPFDRRMADAPRPRGRLRPAELAEAAVLGDVALILSLAGWWLPFGYVLFVAATVPFAALVVRRRLRAAVVAAVAVGQVAFLMGGIGLEGYFFLIAFQSAPCMPGS